MAVESYNNNNNEKLLWNIKKNTHKNAENSENFEIEISTYQYASKRATTFQTQQTKVTYCYAQRSVVAHCTGNKNLRVGVEKSPHIAMRLSQMELVVCGM